MKPFTNKLLCLLSVCLFLASCKAQETPQEPPQLEETAVVVEETTPAAPLPPPATPAAPKEEVKAAPQKQVSSQKTLYPNEVLTQVKNWDQKLKFLKTRFEQTAQYDGVAVSKSQGILYYDKAKHMLRLDTTDTDGKTEQTALTDKQQILILDGQGREITTLSWQEWQQGQPNQALFDFGNYTALLARHHVTLKEPYLLELTPKEGEKYTLYLLLSEQDYFPQRIKIVSDLMETEAVLTDTVKNEPFAFDTFRAGGLFK